MTKKPESSTAALWARFRFSVVGSLLSSPPAGELKAALRALAAKTWTHPVSGGEVHFSPVTIERWYYKSRQKDDPLQVLRRAMRKDCGKVSLTAPLIRQLAQQYDDHPHWTYQLHFDNLAAAVRPILRWDRCDPIARSGATCRPMACSASRGRTSRAAPAKSGGPTPRTARDPQLRSRVRRLAVA